MRQYPSNMSVDFTDGTGESESPWPVFVTCVLSHLPMFLTISVLYRRRLPFECMAGCFSVLVSFMYHTCECFDTIVYLSPLRWHRLDNIGAITSLTVTCVHMACIENQLIVDYAKFAMFFVVVVLQEGRPWDVEFTLLPVCVGVAVPFVSHAMWKRRRKGLLWQRVFVGCALLGMAVVCFQLGLDEKNDPFRMFHGFFHVFVALGIFTFWSSIRSHSTAKRLEEMTNAKAVDFASVVVDA